MRPPLWYTGGEATWDKETMGLMERTILHCDLNCFFASVELRDHPELRHLPVAVCGDPTSRHGIILAKNEPAKAMGVQTAETIWQARKKCPELVLLPPHHRQYRDISRQVNAIYREYTDRVEPFGVDESWLDVTGALHLFGGDGKALADLLRRRVREELGLTISVGVSYNKVFAKLGSDYKKPDATTVIRPQDMERMVWPLPAGAMLFVGRATQRTLEPYGVKTIGDLARFDAGSLETLLGKLGVQLHRYANGLDDEPVAPADSWTPPKSVGNGLTFPQNLTSWDQCRTGLAQLCDGVATELRKNAMVCRTLQLTLRDPKFRDICRQRPLARPSQFARELTEAALGILRDCWRPGSPIRAMTVTAQNLVPQEEDWQQMDLFAGPEEDHRRQKQAHLETAMDVIREKLGKQAIGFSGAVGRDIRDEGL